MLGWVAVDSKGMVAPVFKYVLENKFCNIFQTYPIIFVALSNLLWCVCVCVCVCMCVCSLSLSEISTSGWLGLPMTTRVASLESQWVTLAWKYSGPSGSRSSSRPTTNSFSLSPGWKVMVMVDGVKSAFAGVGRDGVRLTNTRRNLLLRQ